MLFSAQFNRDKYLLQMPPSVVHVNHTTGVDQRYRLSEYLNALRAHRQH